MTLIPVYLEHHTRDVTGSGTFEPEFMGMPLASRGAAVKPPPCIIAHGAGVRGSGQLETYGSASPGVSQLMQEMSQYFTVVMPLLGGDLWGSSLHVARIESARAYLASIGSTGPVTLVCYSMGHTGMANFANTYPSNTRCVIAIEGVQDIANMYSRFPGPAPNFGDDISNAYLGNTALWVARSPITLASALSGLNVPFCELFCQNDSVVLPSTTRVFVDNYLTSLGANLSPIWASGNNGAGQKNNFGKLWWKELGAYDHTDLAILAGAPDASYFARYLSLA